MVRSRIVTLGVSAVLALVGCSSAASAAAKKDVTITACTASPSAGHPTVSGRILNHSSKASLYTIHVKFDDAAGNRAGDAVAVVRRVEAGAPATWNATGTVNVKGRVTCTLASVTRNLSP